MVCKPDSALVIAAHGSTLNPDSSAPSYQHAERLRAGNYFGEVACCFWKEEPSLRSMYYLVESDEIYVVPNFISEGYFTRKIIPRELELVGPITRHGGRLVKYCEPTGNHPGMTDLLLQRAAEAAPGVPPAETALIIVAHGTGLNANSALAAKREAEAIRQMNIYAEVHNAYMEEPPLIAKWTSLTRLERVVVVPFFISDGLHSYEDIPDMLGIGRPAGAVSQGNAIFLRNPFRLHGRQLYYASSIGTDPRFADIILDQVARFDQTHP